MLTNYIQAAMRKAHYEILPNGEGYFARLSRMRLKLLNRWFINSKYLALNNKNLKSEIETLSVVSHYKPLLSL